jgi:hypothetical protein
MAQNAKAREKIRKTITLVLFQQINKTVTNMSSSIHVGQESPVNLFIQPSAERPDPNSILE